MTRKRWLILAMILLTLTSFAAIAQEKASWYHQPNLDRAYDLAKTRILIVVANQFNYSEAVEMAECWKRWGAEVELTGPERTLTGERQDSTPEAASVGKAPTLRVDYLLSEVDPSRYDVLYIAGGEGVADLLTKNREQLARIIDGVHRRGKIVAAICHGPMALAAWPVIKGKKLTVQGHAQRAALEQAGAILLNEVSVVDGQIVTGQWPHLETFAITLAERVQFPWGGGPYEKMMAARTTVERAVDDVRNAHRFEAKPVPPEVLERVVRAAQKACAPPATPGCGTMRFVAIERQTGKARIAELLLERSKAEYAARGIPESTLRPFISSMVEQAPVLFLQFVDSRQQLAKDERDRIERADLVSSGSAVANMVLVARSLGLGVSVLGTPTFLSAEPELRRFLQIPETAQLTGIFSVGYAVLSGTSAPAKPISQMLFFEQWKGNRSGEAQ